MRRRNLLAAGLAIITSALALPTIGMWGARAFSAATA